ncbi:hypothetical protein BN844_4676 [Pseudomonas sp. SHC52]|nr:hypothetical protein BN844_4676 [Pseudomonas sp. SHC52]
MLNRLAHVCSLVGDPKTAFTLVSRRQFLKFIRVMSGIQRMDADHRRTGGCCP